MLDLLQARMATLYRTDAHGRIVATNEWDARPAPRMHLMSTPWGPILGVRDDASDALAARLLDAVHNAQVETWALGSPRAEDACLAALTAEAPVSAIWRGPAFSLLGEPAARGEAEAIDASNVELLRPCFPDWIADVPHRRPFLAVVRGGRAVSLCASVRISAQVHCAGVETHADWRGRGFARAAVAAWAAAVRAAGAVPFYSTSGDNKASQAVAKAVGFETVAVDFHAT